MSFTNCTSKKKEKKKGKGGEKRRCEIDDSVTLPYPFGRGKKEGEGGEGERRNDRSLFPAQQTRGKGKESDPEEEGKKTDQLVPARMAEKNRRGKKVARSAITSTAQFDFRQGKRKREKSSFPTGKGNDFHRVKERGKYPDRSTVPLPSSTKKEKKKQRCCLLPWRKEGRKKSERRPSGSACSFILR